MQPVDAYRACAQIARASGTSFYRGMRLLPGPKRDALFAIYAFARRVDDIADEGGDLAQLEAMRAWRSQLDDPVYAALDDACTRFPIPVDALADLIDGAEMDMRGAQYATFDELEVYCRRVAGSIGRLARRRLRARAEYRARGPARRRVPADEHPARRRRGPRERPRLPPAGGSRPRSASTCDAPETGFARARALRGRARRAVVRRRAAAAPLLDRSSASSVAAMASAYRRLLRAHRARPARGADAPRVAAGVGEGLGGCAQPGGRCERRRRDRRRPRGHRRSARARRRGPQGDAARGAAAARRRDVLLRARRHVGRQRPARRSCAAAPPTARCSTGIGATAQTELQPRLAIPVLRPGGRASWLRRTGLLPRRFTSAASIARFGPLPPADRLRLLPAILALRRLVARRSRRSTSRRSASGCRSTASDDRRSRRSGT